jgi:hypothetical protein
MVTGGGVLIGLAGLLAVIGIARASTRAGTKAAAGGPAISDAAILRAVDRELALVAREREAGGWTPALAARALAALRIAANCALAHPVIQRVAAEEVDRSEGELLVPLRFGRRRLFVSGSSTPLTCSNDLLHTLAHRSRRPNREQRLRELQHILTVLTQVQYGRDESMSPAALDESLAAGRRLVRSLRRELQWVTRTFTSLADGTTGLRQRVWSR